MIALREESWTSTNAGPVYFDSVSGKVKIPSDVKLQIANEWPARSESLRKLYKRLGVQNLRTKSVAEAILGIYAETRRYTITLEQSVKHVQYLYEAKITDDFDNVFLFDFHGGKAATGTLYMDDAADEPNTISKLFGADQSTIKFVHPAYIELGKGMPEEASAKFLRWLKSSFNVATMVRFNEGYNISADFKYLCKELNQLQVLTVLRDNWKSYKPHYVRHQKIRGYISGRKWRCINKRGRRPFSETCLSLTGLKDIAGEFGPIDIFPFLRVPTPIDQMTFLGQLGVITEPNMQFLIWILKEIRNNGEDWSHEKAVALYTRIAACEDIQSLSRYGHYDQIACLKGS